jgi:hypothetical protein
MNLAPLPASCAHQICISLLKRKLSQVMKRRGTQQLIQMMETTKMSDYRVKAGEISEDQITSLLESQSAKVPTSFFLGASLASIATSLLLKAQGKHDTALFVGQWAAPFLLLGIYNKMVKQHGSDATE